MFHYVRWNLPHFKSITRVSKIRKNIQTLKNFDFKKSEEDLANRKYEAVKKIFCNVLFIENNPLFVEEMLWRFLVSPPSVFNARFKEPGQDIAEKIVKEGFAGSIENYLIKAKFLNKQIDLKGKIYLFVHHIILISFLIKLDFKFSQNFLLN